MQSFALKLCAQVGTISFKQVERTLREFLWIIVHSHDNKLSYKLSIRNQCGVVSKVDVSLLFSTFDGPGKIINGAMFKFGV